MNVRWLLWILLGAALKVVARSPADGYTLYLWQRIRATPEIPTIAEASVPVSSSSRGQGSSRPPARRRR